MALERIVVVGASLAGVRTAEALRREGFAGSLVIVGEEDLAPYDRPPLSKQVLTGAWPPEKAKLRVEDSVANDLRLATRAVDLDLDRRQVTLHTGATLAFDGLVIATGARPRDIPGLGPHHLLRTFDDAMAIRGAAEAAGASGRAAVVGAGFIGAEVASSLRALGLEVTILEALPVPMERAVGSEMGAVLGGLHADAGVQLLTATPADRGHPALATADLVVVGVGVQPNTEWLEGSGLTLDDGVVCDATCAALGALGVVAVGDVARWDHPAHGLVRIEHWTNAVEQADAAARTLLGHPQPFAPVPYFWSDQYGHKIQFVGYARPDDSVEVVEGSVAEHRFLAVYRRGGRPTAVLGIGMPARVMAWRRELIPSAA